MLVSIVKVIAVLAYDITKYDGATVAGLHVVEVEVTREQVVNAQLGFPEYAKKLLMVTAWV